MEVEVTADALEAAAICSLGPEITALVIQTPSMQVVCQDVLWSLDPGGRQAEEPEASAADGGR